MGKEQQHGNLSRETGILEEKPGSEVQIQMAKALVDILGRDRPLTRDDFHKIDQPLSLASRDAGDDIVTQENLMRIFHENQTWGVMRQFVNILALVAAEGNEDRAKDLLGGSDSYEEQPEFIGRIRENTKPAEARTRPQTSAQARALYQRWKKQHGKTPPESSAQPPTSQAKSIYQQWKERGSPTTAKPALRV